MNAVLIYSGGLDSTVLLYEYKESIRLAITFTYGAKQDEEQLKCAQNNCKLLGIKHLSLPLDFIGRYFKSSLLKGGAEIPHEGYDEDNMRSTVVPFRNGIMLSIAAGLAESEGLDTVLLANHSGDHSIYPDCRGEFIDAIDKAVRNGTYAGVRIVSPYKNLNKRDIALKGKKMDVPFEKTYSCYEGRRKHCGLCATCIERKEALQGFDATEYEDSGGQK